MDNKKVSTIIKHHKSCVAIMMTSQQPTSELGHFIRHLHGCCLHDYRGEDLKNVLLNGQYAGEDEDGRWIMLLLHPRWCPECIQERSHAINIGYDQRLLKLKHSKAHVEQVRTEKGYLQGVRDGRVRVLSTSFAELPGWRDEEAVENGKMEDVAEMLEDMKVELRAEGPVERDEALAEMFGEKNLGGDAMDEDFEQCFQDEEAYQRGFEEGMKEQSENEWIGIHETDWDKRKHLLEMALL